MTKPDIAYIDPGGTKIDEKAHLRDLGVEISSDLSFSLHIENTSKQNGRLGDEDFQEEIYRTDALTLEVSHPEQAGLLLTAVEPK